MVMNEAASAPVDWFRQRVARRRRLFGEGVGVLPVARGDEAGTGRARFLSMVSTYR